MNKIGLKIRAAVITTVYNKSLAVSLTTLSKFSSGEVCVRPVCCLINYSPTFFPLLERVLVFAFLFFVTVMQVVNFMSTDTDRVVNFAPSFHQFWSLPFQIAVSLYLLHQQVPLSFIDFS